MWELIRICTSGYSKAIVKCQVSHPDFNLPIILKHWLNYHVCTFGHFPHRWDLPIFSGYTCTSQPGQDTPGSCGRGLAAVGDAAGAGLDHHHLLLGEPVLGATENHPHRPGVGGAAAAPLRTGQGAEPGTVGSGAPAALLFKLNGQRWTIAALAHPWALKYTATGRIVVTMWLLLLCDQWCVGICRLVHVL